MNCEPIHAVRSWAKVRALARAVRRNEKVMPYVIDGIPGNCNLITGTHRVAANRLLEKMGDTRRIGYVYLEDLQTHPAYSDVLEYIKDGNFGEVNFLVDEINVFDL